MQSSFRFLLALAVVPGSVGLYGVSGLAAEDAAAPQAAVEQTAVEGDLARKIEIMHSERWQRAIFEFGQWLSTQTIYSPEEVAQIKHDFNERVGRMSSYELTYLLDDLDAKLSILPRLRLKTRRPGWGSIFRRWPIPSGHGNYSRCPTEPR